jgi:predicted nucleic acid-binding protein
MARWRRTPEAPPPVRCKDPDDDYLIALAHSRSAALISGDRHLLELAGKIPVFSPAEFPRSERPSARAAWGVQRKR